MNIQNDNGSVRVKESCFSLLLNTVIHRGTLCWWGDRLEKRATKENWSVSVQMGPRCFGSFFLINNFPVVCVWF